MVSLSQAKNGVYTGFNIEKLLDNKTADMPSTLGTDFQHNSESAFKILRAHGKAVGHGSVNDQILSPSAFPTSAANTPCAFGGQWEQNVHKSDGAGDCCSQCFESSASHIHEHLLNSVRSYDMSTQCISNINNSNTGNLIRSTGFPNHHHNPWSVLDTSPHAANAQTHDIRTHHNLGNFGLKFHNSLMQLDNLSHLSNISNIASIANGYTPFSNLYTPMTQGQLGTQMVSSRMEPGVGVAAHAFPWASTRGAGFLTSRCPDTGLFMPSYRKPKRVRTAFSPTQLLRLEHAFEKNHYVVGQERKDLSASLNLSETQVKVWFQNRRTKHKRMQIEDEMTSSLSRRLGHNERQHSNQSTTPSLEDVIIDT